MSDLHQQSDAGGAVVGAQKRQLEPVRIRFLIRVRTSVVMGGDDHALSVLGVP
jgi:hypothetical protein